MTVKVIRVEKHKSSSSYIGQMETIKLATMEFNTPITAKFCGELLILLARAYGEDIQVKINDKD